MVRRASALIGFMFGAVLAGCSGESESDYLSEVIVRDSAGIMIVESPAGSEALAPVWEVDPTPIVRIGTIMGNAEYQFGRIDGVTQLSDGRIVALDGQERELRYYSPEGEFLLRAGRSGEGPGEIFPTGTARIFPLPGDTLAVLSLQRLTLFSSEGEFLETVTANYVPLGLLDHRAGIIWQSRTGITEPGWADGMTAQANNYVRVSFEEPQTTDTLTLKYSRMTWSSGATTMVNAIGPNGQVTQIPLPTGSTVPLTHPPISYVRVGGFSINDWRSRNIEVFDGSGRLIRIQRVAGGLEPATQEHLDALAAYAISQRPPDAPPSQETPYEGMPLPPTVPAYAPAMVSGMNRMLMGADGEIWIGRFDPATGYSSVQGARPDVWTAFDSQGRVAGTVHMPERFTPFELTPEGVLGVYRDDFDVEYVQHVRVHRPEER